MKEMFHSSNRIYQFGLNIAGVLMLKKFKKGELEGGPLPVPHPAEWTLCRVYSHHSRSGF